MERIKERRENDEFWASVYKPSSTGSTDYQNVTIEPVGTMNDKDIQEKLKAISDKGKERVLNSSQPQISIPGPSLNYESTPSLSNDSKEFPNVGLSHGGEGMEVSKESTINPSTDLPSIPKTGEGSGVLSNELDEQLRKRKKGVSWFRSKSIGTIFTEKNRNLKAPEAFSEGSTPISSPINTSKPEQLIKLTKWGGEVYGIPGDENPQLIKEGEDKALQDLIKQVRLNRFEITEQTDPRGDSLETVKGEVKSNI